MFCDVVCWYRAWALADPHRFRLVFTTPHGSGRTVERVTGPGIAEIESERLRGTQTVTFEPGGDEVRVIVRDIPRCCGWA